MKIALQNYSDLLISQKNNRELWINEKRDFTLNTLREIIEENSLNWGNGYTNSNEIHISVPHTMNINNKKAFLILKPKPTGNIEVIAQTINKYGGELNKGEIIKEIPSNMISKNTIEEILEIFIHELIKWENL